MDLVGDDVKYLAHTQEPFAEHLICVRDCTLETNMRHGDLQSKVSAL